MKRLPIFDYWSHCQPCLQCCKSERLYLSEEERANFGMLSEGENCKHLADDGRCLIHDSRPMECRLFPLDIKRLDGALTWVVWQSCPATPFLSLKEFESQASELELRLTDHWAEAYVAHHDQNEPEKYQAMSFRVLRRLRGNPIVVD